MVSVLRQALRESFDAIVRFESFPSISPGGMQIIQLLAVQPGKVPDRKNEICLSAMAYHLPP